MFQIKICGITRPADAVAAADAGADAIGLNFFPGSTRCVNRAQAAEIAASVRDRVHIVGVFVNASLVELLETYERVSFHSFQLHGDESPDVLAALHARFNNLAGSTRQRPLVIRALRCNVPNLQGVAQYLNDCRTRNAIPAAVLLDAYRSGQFGGTGESFDWSIVPRDRALLEGVPVVLAGGLNPQNVVDAIQTARPNAVDTASGVETEPGKKDPARMARFVRNAREAFDRLAESDD